MKRWWSAGLLVITLFLTACHGTSYEMNRLDFAVAAAFDTSRTEKMKMAVLSSSAVYIEALRNAPRSNPEL